MKQTSVFSRYWGLGAMTILSLALFGCSNTNTMTSSSTEGRYTMKQDRGPSDHVDMSGVAEAVPKIEVLSKGGNKPTYEVWGKKYHVMPSGQGFVQRGLASWYGKKFHGHLTANGEIYDMYAMTAAHKQLPLPTFARITNLENGKIVIVRVNDRGPFHGDRVIDLSYAAASRLGYRKKGVAQVLIEAIGAVSWSATGEQLLRQQRQQQPLVAAVNVATNVTPMQQTAKPMPAVTTAHVAQIRKQTARIPGFYVQVVALTRLNKADILRADLANQLKRADVWVEQSQSGKFFRVLVGPIADHQSAELLGQKVIDLDFDNSLLLFP